MATHETASESRKRRLLRACGWLVVPLLIACAWSGWREYDHRAAVREARAAGFEWREVTASAVIRKDWRAAFRQETWSGRLRELDLGKVPTLLNVDALKELPSLQSLDLTGCDTIPLPALHDLRRARPSIQIQMPNRYFEAYPLKKSP